MPLQTVSEIGSGHSNRERERLWWKPWGQTAPVNPPEWPIWRRGNRAHNGEAIAGRDVNDHRCSMDG